MRLTANQKKALQFLPKTVSVLKKEIKSWKAPIVGTFANGPNAPFKILISTVLSLRTKDKTTEEASHRLFQAADTPESLLQMDVKEIEKLIYPVGFYRTKARNIHSICEALLGQFSGKVPDSMEELLLLRGVGRKTANLVLTVGYHKPGICVDTHVHRISNRLGLVKTQFPDDTEAVLRQILPKRYWITFNDILVTYGQNLCLPVSPHCSRCKIRKYCPRIGVERHR